MNLKLVSARWTGVHSQARKDVTYAVGQVTMAPDWDPTPVCGGGIHYAEGLSDYMPHPSDDEHLIEVEPVGEIVRVGWNKTKAQGIRVIREITRIPSIRNEPNGKIRVWISARIPPDKIHRILTRKQEPVLAVRAHIIGKILVGRIHKILSEKEEPNERIRKTISDHIPYKHIKKMPSPAEERSPRVRHTIARRIRRSKITKRMIQKESNYRIKEILRLRKNHKRI